MAVLSKVDQGTLDLKQTIHVQPSDCIPKESYSPIREQFPDGVDLTVRDLLKYTILSDGSAADVLLRTIGGIEVAQDYVYSLGIEDIAIAIPEMILSSTKTGRHPRL